MFQTLTSSQKKWLLIGTIVFMVGGTGTLINQLYSIDSLNIEQSTPSSVSLPQNHKQQRIAIHIAGAVVAPGVYQIPIGTRTLDALSYAKGPLPNANLDRVNLAKILSDGQKITVPFLKVSTKKRVNESKVSLNNASKKDLMTLPGIGPALATRILVYRNKTGKIDSIQSLIQVKGISQKKLSKLRVYLTL